MMHILPLIPGSLFGITVLYGVPSWSETVPADTVQIATGGAPSFLSGYQTSWYRDRDISDHNELDGGTAWTRAPSSTTSSFASSSSAQVLSPSADMTDMIDGSASGGEMVAATMTVNVQMDRPGAYATGPEVFGVGVYEMMSYHASGRGKVRTESASRRQSIEHSETLSAVEALLPVAAESDGMGLSRSDTDARLFAADSSARADGVQAGDNRVGGYVGSNGDSQSSTPIKKYIMPMAWGLSILVFFMVALMRVLRLQHTREGGDGDTHSIMMTSGGHRDARQ